MKGHACTLPTTAESFDFSGNVKKSKYLPFKQIWANICKIGENTPRTKMYLVSMAAVSAERRRHASLPHWWIVHPFSHSRFVWDVTMMVVLLIAFLTIPFVICFVVMCHDAIYLDRVNLLIYAFCWVDIVCNCLTGYNEKKRMRVVLEPSKILKQYLKTLLIPDILSSLPWDHITLPWRRLPGENSSRLIVLVNLLPLLKLSRYGHANLQILEMFTVKRCLWLSKWCRFAVLISVDFILTHDALHMIQYFKVLHFYYEMATTLMLAFYIMFWFTCLCYLIPIMVLQFINSLPEDCQECWITGLKGNTIAGRFQNALFIVVEKLSASGYGLFVPGTDGHTILSCILMITGRFIECYILVMLIQIKAGRKSSKSKFQEIINQVAAYTRQKQLPPHMKKRLLDYYYYRFRNSYFREKLILSTLSEQLRQEIALQSSHRLVENVAIFKALPKYVLRSIIKNLRFELYLSNDVIVKAGAQGDCMFFLSAGTVAVLTPTGKEICHLDDGAHFGEVALLVPDQRRVASVIAIEVCEVYRLDRRDFRKCIAVHTELFAKIERIATERVERAMVIEEQHQRYLMRSSASIHESKRSRRV